MLQSQGDQTQEEVQAAYQPWDKSLLGQGQLTSAASSSPNKSGGCPHESQEVPRGAAGTPEKLPG